MFFQNAFRTKRDSRTHIAAKNQNPTPPSKGDVSENNNVDGSSNGHEPGEHYKFLTFEINTIILHISRE